MFLTCHFTLDYHLNNYKHDKILQTCPRCSTEEETTNHIIGQCPKWSAEKRALLQSFCLSVTGVVDNFTVFVMIQFINDVTEWQKE